MVIVDLFGVELFIEVRVRPAWTGRHGKKFPVIPRGQVFGAVFPIEPQVAPYRSFGQLTPAGHAPIRPTWLWSADASARLDASAV